MHQWKSILVALMVCCALPLAGYAQLTHRYSFNDGTANDSVGGANGTLMNGATVSGGQLQLINNGSNNPTSGEYVNLPSDILNTKAFTVEAWATEQSNVAWQRILDLGNSVNGNGSGYIILTPYNNPHTPLGQVSTSSGATNFASGPIQGGNGYIAQGQQYQYAYVHDVTTGTEELYIDGLPVINQSSTPFTATIDASQLSLSNFWIGRSQYAADPYFDGSINELRTYAQALTPAQGEAEYVAGPDVVTVPEPATAVLAGIGVALASMRRRQRADATSNADGFRLHSPA